MNQITPASARPDLVAGAGSYSRTGTGLAFIAIGVPGGRRCW